MKRRGRLPPTATHITVFLHVVPHRTAVRAGVMRRFRQLFAENGMIAVRVFVAGKVIEAQHMGFAAFVARHHADALVRQLHFGGDCRDARNSRRTA